MMLFTLRRCIALFVVGIIMIPTYTFSGNLLGSQFTIQDIIDGISARKSSIHSLEIAYSVNTQWTDFYREVAKKKKIHVVYRNGKREDPRLETEALPEIENYVESYRLGIRDGKLYKDLLDPKTGKKLSQFSYSDGVLKEFLPDDLRGSIQRSSFNESLPSVTPDEQFSIDHSSLLEYLKNDNVTKEIVDVKNKGGDLFITLSGRRTKRVVKNISLCGGPGLADSWRADFYAATAGAFSASYSSGER